MTKAIRAKNAVEKTLKKLKEVDIVAGQKLVKDK